MNYRKMLLKKVIPYFLCGILLGTALILNFLAFAASIIEVKPNDVQGNRDYLGPTHAAPAYFPLTSLILLNIFLIIIIYYYVKARLGREDIIGEFTY